MTEPTRTSTGIAYLTFDATLNTDASMIIQQKLDLSGNTTAQTFCENAFDLAAGEDISGALLSDSDITDYNSNNLVYLGSNDVNVQKTFLNNKLNSSIAQNIACNAYEMTLGKNNQIPLVSNLGPPPPFRQITETKIVASDRAAEDYFGVSVAISGNYAIVGAWNDSNNGSAYIFERDTNGTWSQKQKIVASDGQASDQFGFSVAISGNYAIVGAWRDDSNKGSAYIFERNTNGTWSQKQKIVASDREEQGPQLVGISVAISGNYAIIGGRGYDSNTGSAFIFERNTNGTWSQKQKIVASDGEDYAYFGESVAISGNYAIVGAWGHDDMTGSAYIIERNTNGTWSQKQKIVSSDLQFGDYFGYSVAISGNYAIVGATYEDHDANGTSNSSIAYPFDPDYKTKAGSAYIFERNTNGTWSQIEKIVASDRGAGDKFGNSVAISGNYAIVGANNEHPDEISDAGSAYIFERNTDGTWTQIEKIVASDRQPDDRFGISVAISGNYAIVGADYEDHDANGTSNSTTTDSDYKSKAGSAYIFKG